MLRAPLAALVLLSLTASARAAGEFQITPSSVTLEGNFARAQLVVTASDPKGTINERSADLTHAATYQSSRPEVITVSRTGQLLAVGDGQAVVTVTVGKVARTVPVTVRGVAARPQIGFTDQVLPILSRAGCNAGACHAAQYGQGGFKLSVFASEPYNHHPPLT